MLLCCISLNLDMLEAVNYAKNLSNTDFLSGLFNRRYFFEQGIKILKSLVNQSYDQEPRLTVMIVDIDLFKKINDKFGHGVGDIVIKNFASQLKSRFPHDLVARIGGEEFAIMSQSLQYLNIFDYINQFREMIAAQALQVNGDVLRYSCSIDLTSVIGRDVDEMIMHTDKRLYKVKHNGLNQISGILAN